MKLFIRTLPWLLAFSLAAGLGLYFRMHPLRNMDAPSPERMARALVARVMTEQVKKAIDAQNLPAISNDDKWKMAGEQVQRLIEADKAQFEAAVKRAEAGVRQSMPQVSGRKYLLEADPYYYFYLTENISRTGKIADQIKGAKYFHPLMHAPYGYWTAVTWHPYVGWGLYQIIRIFYPNVPLMEGLCPVPLILTVLAGICFLFFALAFGAQPFAFLIGSLTLMLSPIFIQRSGYGWYDTDPYNYIFPFSILACVLTGIRRPDKTKLFAVISGLLTGLYAMFWTGWAFMLLLIPGALFATFLAIKYGFRLSLSTLQTEKKYFLFHVIASLVFAVYFLTPAGFLDSVSNGWVILKKFSLSETDVWPNIFLTVGEARGISVRKLIFLSGNYLTFGLAVYGLIQNLWHAWKTRTAAALFRPLFLLFLSIPLFLLPLKTERFGILFVIPLSIYAMMGAQEIYRLLTTLLGRVSLSFLKWDWRKAVSSFCILILFLPLPLLSAQLVSDGIKPIMDDAWYNTMEQIREKTPENAIINSWWPPGYFTVGLAKRRVIVDGGTQHLQEAYWMARILTSQDEKEAAGLLRMLNTSGNDALLYLKSLGVDISEAVLLITSVAPLTREEAMKKLPAQMPEKVKKQLLQFTHGGIMPPTYLLVYDDLMEQNLAVTMISRWNFQKARAKKQNEIGGLFGFLSRRGTSNYVQDFVSLTDGILKYTPAVGMNKKDGDAVYFPNGLRVNLANKDAMIELPGVRGRPTSLFFLENGQLVEKTFEGERVDAAALLYRKEDGSYQSVMADARLIRSMLFRLYYLNGEGLKVFKPFSAETDPYRGTQVKVFQMTVPDDKPAV